MAARTLPAFRRQLLDPVAGPTRIGAGALGGKASGLVALHEDVIHSLPPAATAEFVIDVPRLVVVATDVFTSFIHDNGLADAEWSELSDRRIAGICQQAHLPPICLGDLRSLTETVHQPLAVRSSSLLEDALAHPFAGVYATKMIPNRRLDPDYRFGQLDSALKFVFASTFFAGARSYREAVGVADHPEAMAVVVQEVIGRRHGARFYPDISGVARSWNPYPMGRSRPEDGVVNLALGLGKQIVDGGLSWTYAPNRPQAPPPAAGPQDLLRNSQTTFWAVNMGPPPLPDPLREEEHLVQADLTAAEEDGVLPLLVSTFDGETGRLRPGVQGQGPRLLDFSPLLQHRLLPLNDVVRAVLAAAEAAAGQAVELEFAVTLAEGAPPRLGLLQMRPMAVAEGDVEVSEADLAAPDLLLASEHVLGNGTRDDLRDVVYLRPDVFDARHTPRIAAELETLNRGLVAAGRPYLLLGFGRWGSSDPWLGVPVTWPQIGGARVIVEATLPGLEPELSQGSHFFHNLIGLRILYLSVPHRGPRRIAWERLDRLPAIDDTGLVRHVRLDRPLSVRVDGRRGRGVVTYHDA
ncbi:MAG TPA: PEP/pyruvate-binding domain-containing protein [Candidatus Krumholzibacteria bacterium]|nr:PEP/pyruvate-binding domain-containing protein [Candidatus Krumholzibacteria bacterium]HPD71044.1 PEP/pyruvate-binding domain-containing protein [Candidatus Krumholzibacteria bacterium]HRY39256.1 PEP/pyruvate-binding domain-containing protein [Candidatus Krumholzibacteria bacterium]